MLKIEKKLFDKVINHLDILIFIFITLAGLMLRYYGRDFVSEDMDACLVPWFNVIKQSGGLAQLVNQIGNYGILYQTIIALMTYIDANPIYMYKLVSIIFDFGLALSSAVLVCNIKKEKKFSFTFNTAYALVWCLTIFVLDSAYWGQCDSIYVFFIIVSIIQLFKNKYISSFVLLGFALAFKLQALFIFPFFFMEYLKEKKFSILYFLIPIAVLVLSGLPAFVLGRNFLAPIEIYLSQTSQYNEMSLNFNSFWNIVGDKYRWLRLLAITTTIIILVMIMYYILKKKSIDYSKNKISIAILLTWSTVMFLPKMHERYDYMLIVFLLIQLLIDKKYYISVILVVLMSTISYSFFLFGKYNGGVTLYTTFIYMFAYFAFIRIFVKNND